MSQFSITIVFYNVADTNEYTHISVTASAVKTDSSIITLIGLFVQRIATTRNCFAVLCVCARSFTVTVAVVVANDHLRVTCHAIIANGLSPFLSWSAGTITTRVQKSLLLATPSRWWWRSGRHFAQEAWCNNGDSIRD